MARLKHVFLTHLHADFVSGHRELATRTGGQVILGTAGGASCLHHAAWDGEELWAGGYRI